MSLCRAKAVCLFCCCCIDIRDTVFSSDRRGWLWQHTRGPSEDGGKKWENVMEVKKRDKPWEVAEAKKCRQEDLWKAKTVRRSKYKQLSSEALHAIVSVIFCNALLACHKNKVSCFPGLVAPFLWQIQNVLLKPLWKMPCLAAKRGTKDGWKITPEADEPWVTRSSSAEINSKQRVPAEMTCVHETDLSHLDIFQNERTLWCIFQRGPVGFRSNLPVCLSKNVPQFCGKTAKDVRKEFDLIADMGNGRWNRVKISSVKCLCAKALD